MQTVTGNQQEAQQPNTTRGWWEEKLSSSSFQFNIQKSPRHTNLASRYILQHHNKFCPKPHYFHTFRPFCVEMDSFAGCSWSGHRRCYALQVPGIQTFYWFFRFSKWKRFFKTSKNSWWKSKASQWSEWLLYHRCEAMVCSCQCSRIGW